MLRFLGIVTGVLAAGYCSAARSLQPIDQPRGEQTHTLTAKHSEMCRYCQACKRPPYQRAKRGAQEACEVDALVENVGAFTPGTIPVVTDWRVLPGVVLPRTAAGTRGTRC